MNAIILALVVIAPGPRLTGVGIVRGQTGDPEVAQRYGIKLEEDCCLCLVDAYLPKPGGKLIFRVSTLDGAGSLDGCELLPCKLLGMDREISAVASGKLRQPKEPTENHPNTAFGITVKWKPISLHTIERHDPPSTYTEKSPASKSRS